MDENLIEHVRQHEVLYNHSLADYRDQHVRQEAWEEIGRDLKITADNAKIKWDKLRRCFSNARNRRLSTKSGQATKNITAWKFEPQMAFLTPYLEGRKTRGNLHSNENDTEVFVPDERTTNEEGDDADQIEVQEYNADTEDAVDGEDRNTVTQKQLVSLDDLLRAENTKSLEQIKINKKKKMTAVDRMVLMMEENAGLRKRKLEEKEVAQKKLMYVEDMNDNEMFFLSLAKMTKKLPKAVQATVKMKVSNIILEAELENAQIQSSHHVQTSTTSSYPSQPFSPTHDHSRPSTSSSYNVQPLPSSFPPRAYHEAGHELYNVRTTSEFSSHDFS